MSWYDDHIIAVAKRMVTKFQNGETISNITKYLQKAGWNDSEVNRITTYVKKYGGN